MRRSILFLVGLVFVSGALAACTRGEPRISVETPRLDLGDVPNGEIAARDVAVRNDGDALLVVEEITTSCGCTTATVDPVRLGPGEEGQLHIEFDAGAHGPELRGPQIRQVFITSNDATRPELIVELAVNITAPRTSN